MREIKFRSWDLLHKRMYIVWNIRATGIGGGGMIVVSVLDAGPINVNLNPFSDDTDHVLMQYIGLKDRNGKEIYEGDLIKDVDGRVSTHAFPEDWEWLEMMHNDVEVIGNIYENPDLVEDLK
jgi:uncharacterized phage protein (TIGR01671 family)